MKRSVPRLRRSIVLLAGLALAATACGSTVPRAQLEAALANGNSNGGSASFRLEYEGKTSVAEVLATEPAKLRPLVTIEGQPKNRVIYGDNLGVLRALHACWRLHTNWTRWFDQGQ